MTQQTQPAVTGKITEERNAITLEGNTGDAAFQLVIAKLKPEGDKPERVAIKLHTSSETKNGLTDSVAQIILTKEQMTVLPNWFKHGTGLMVEWFSGNHTAQTIV